MKVTFILSHTNNGGVEQVVAKICEGLRARRDHPNVFLLVFKPLGDYFGALREIPHAVIDRRGISGLLACISFERQDILVCPPSNVALIYWIFLRARHKVLIIDNANFLSEGRGIRSTALTLLRRYAVWRASRLVATYETASEAIRVSSGRMPTVIYNPVAATFFKRDEPIDKDVDLVYVGRLEREKGPDIFVEALGILKQKYCYEPTVRIFGTGSLLHELKRRADHLGLNELDFIGYSNDIKSEMLKSRYLVVSSRTEGCSGVVKEAISLGIPVIVPDVRSNGPQEMIGYGELGLVFEAGSPQDLSRKILSALTGDFDYNQSLSRVRRLDFTIDQAAAKYATLFSELK